MQDKDVMKRQMFQKVAKGDSPQADEMPLAELADILVDQSAQILSVRAFTERVRQTLESRFPFVWVRGEVTNLSRPSSGHIYFTLKDEEAQLQCVWFRQRQREARNFDPLTGEVFDGSRLSAHELLDNGCELLCAGCVSVYGPRGQYQLVIELVQASGAGALAQAFEERKRKLAAAGYFAQERKRALPKNPGRVALITSPCGAAIHDFIQLAQVRGCASQIRIFPVLVQGEKAAPEIVAAIEEANAQEWAEAIVLIRGGGSLEDLWAFNELSVAESIFHSRIPVLAGIGHEVDVSLADLTADQRAATPSHAAQLLWPLRSELRQRVDELEIALTRSMEVRLERAAYELKFLERDLLWSSPAQTLRRYCEQLANLDVALLRAMQNWFEEKIRLLDGLELRRLSLFTADGFRTKELELEMLMNTLNLLAGQLVARDQSLLDRHESNLKRNVDNLLGDHSVTLDKFELCLLACDPMKPLERGYALLFQENGVLARSVSDFAPGQSFSARLFDGDLNALVKTTIPNISKGDR